MKVRRRSTSITSTSDQGRVRSLEVLQNLLALAEGLAEAETEVAAPGEPVPADWAQQVVDALLNRIMRRMPKAGSKETPGEQCPFTGLNRGQLYELLALRRNGAPVIQSFSLREKGEASGARFYNVGSVLAHLRQLAEEQDRKAGN